MNWITNYVRPRINSIFSRREVPENLWTKCDSCGTMLFHREVADNLGVCTSCAHHMNITPRARFTALFDGGVFNEIAVPEPITDPLQFRDQKKYPDRMKAAQKSTGEREAMLVAAGEINRTPVVACAQDFSFMAGSMGMYVGNAIVAAAEEAVKLKRPLILFSAAGGARMQEGILSLMQMPRTTVAVQMLREAGLPYIVVLTHPTTGGVTASYAMLGDVQIAEPGALICFAAPRSSAPAAPAPTWRSAARRPCRPAARAAGSAASPARRCRAGQAQETSAPPEPARAEPARGSPRSERAVVGAACSCAPKSCSVPGWPQIHLILIGCSRQRRHMLWLLMHAPPRGRRIAATCL